MTYDLKLPKPEENRATLALFWETAQPLKHVVAELPDISGGQRINIKPVFPRSALVPGATAVDLLNASVSSEVEIVFRNLPEPLFERLALRFRPFYANDEEVNFLKLLNLVSQLNSDLHPWKKERKAAWERAVFWGAMSMPEQTPTVKAEDVIKAGLYSRYFHVNKVHREKALAYEKSLGRGCIESHWSHRYGNGPRSCCRSRTRWNNFWWRWASCQRQLWRRPRHQRCNHKRFRSR